MSYWWHWVTTLGIAILVGRSIEIVTVRAGTRRLGPAAGVSAAALAATIVGFNLFPPLAVDSPHPLTFSLAGALVYDLFWITNRLCHTYGTEYAKLRVRGLVTSCLVLGVLSGVAAGVLSCEPLQAPLYLAPVGFIGGLLLAIPYLVVWCNGSRRRRHRMPKPDEKLSNSQ